MAKNLVFGLILTPLAQIRAAISPLLTLTCYVTLEVD